MSKFISLPLQDGTEFVFNTDFILTIKNIDGLGALVLYQPPFRGPQLDGLVDFDGSQMIRTTLSFDELKSLLGVVSA